MIKRSSRQTGSAQIVIIIVLVIALLGELGFFIWKTVSDSAAETERREAAKIVKYRTYKDAKLGMSFEYPSTWRVDVSTVYENDAEYGDKSISIETDKGKVLSLQTNVENFNDFCGTADYNPYIPYNVLDVIPTTMPTRYEASTYLSFILAPMEEGDDMYDAQYGLTSEFTKPGEHMACYDIYQFVFSPKIDTIDTRVNTHQLLSFSGSEQFKTEDEAKKFIASDEYKAIKRAILSLKY
jgi:hypothetical protein